MKLLINYANHIFTDAQKICSKSGLEVGGFDKVIRYSPKDIDQDFYRKNQAILRCQRGGGYWLWKPYFIKKSLAQLNDGDFLFYLDSAAYFIDSIDPLCQILHSSGEGVMQFEIQHIEKVWTKRDVFIAINCDSPKYTESGQRQGGVALFEAGNIAKSFVREWLSLAQNAHLIDDSPSEASNYDGFIEHRHDQSIWSLLGKKHNLGAYRDPSQHGNHLNHPNSPYGQIITLTRHTRFRLVKVIRVISRLISKIKRVYKTF